VTTGVRRALCNLEVLTRRSADEHAVRRGRERLVEILIGRHAELGFDVAGVVAFQGLGHDVEQATPAKREQLETITAERAQVTCMTLADRTKSGDENPHLR
jgi:hypothetical protein